LGNAIESFKKLPFYKTADSASSREQFGSADTRRGLRIDLFPDLHPDDDRHGLFLPFVIAVPAFDVVDSPEVLPAAAPVPIQAVAPFRMRVAE
jgi:hypothetical protein